MSFNDFLAQDTSSPFLLTEGSVYERLRRLEGINFDPFLAHGALIYTANGMTCLGEVHREYLEIGLRFKHPMVLLTDTWRASQDRIQKSSYRHRSVNEDNVRFIRTLVEVYATPETAFFVGGLMGPAGDAYLPGDALTEVAAFNYHLPQVKELAHSGVDFLIASTLPALSEARGIAVAMSQTTLPYILSFVIRKDGRLLDQTPLTDAIRSIDLLVDRKPVGYLVNCVHPDVFKQAITLASRNDEMATRRIIGLQANTSARSPEELDRLDVLETEDPQHFAASLFEVYRTFGLRIIGGCCGTDGRHIEALARLVSFTRDPEDRGKRALLPEEK